MQFQALQQKSQVKFNFIFEQNLIFIERLEIFHIAFQLSAFHQYLLITGWTLGLVYLLGGSLAEWLERRI